MGKLVRDRIPEIIREHGGDPAITILDDTGYVEALFEKLIEEANEVVLAKPETVAEELADCLEVLQAIASATGIGWGAVERTAGDKRAARGGFAGRVWLE